MIKSDFPFSKKQVTVSLEEAKKHLAAMDPKQRALYGE
jgi:hypothetical protein